MAGTGVLPAQAQDGTDPLDATFGDGDGMVITDIGSGADVARAVVRQNDGKIVVVGHSHNGADDDFAVVRYLADGSLDTNFGDGGKVVTDIWSSNDQAHAVALQGDKIIVAGHIHNGRNDEFAVVRYDADGLLDTTFGDDGLVTFLDIHGHRLFGTSFPGTPVLGDRFEFTANVSGLTAKHYNGDGEAVDYTSARRGDVFNYDGAHWVLEGSPRRLGASLPGTPEAGDRFEFNAAATNLTKVVGHDGTPVTTASSGDLFEYDGVHWIKRNLEPAHDARVTAVSAQSDGTIVMDGYRSNPTGAEHVKYVFGSNGTYQGGRSPVRVNADITPGVGQALAMAVRDDGAIAVAGYKGGDFAVALYTAHPDHSGLMVADSAFHRDGVAIHDFGGNDRARAVAWVDGDIVAVGSSGNRFALVRYAVDGTLVASVTTAVGSGQDRAYAVAPSGDGKIVVAGSSSDDFAVVRYVSPPDVPTITSGSIANRVLTLIWTEPAGNPTGYDVQYQPPGSDYWIDLGHMGTDLTTSVWGLSDEMEHRLRVRSRNLMGVSEWSTVFNVASRGDTLPGVVTGLSANAGSNNLALTWRAPDAVDYYEIQYKPSGRSDWRFAGRVVHVARIIWGLYGGVQYDVRVRAVNSVGTGDWSETVQATPTGGVPSHVVAMGLTATPGDRSLALAWNKTSDRIVGYEIQYKKSVSDDQSWVDIAHDGLSRIKTLRGLNNWVHYDVRVRGTYANGRGPWVEVQAAPGLNAGELGNPSSVSVTLSENPVEEPSTVTVTATLNEPAPSGGVKVKFWAEGATSGSVTSPASPTSDFRWSESDRGVEYGNGLETNPIVVGPGETTATVTLKIHHNAPANEPKEGVGIRATVELLDTEQNRLVRYLYSPTVVMTIAEYEPPPLPPPSSVTLSMKPLVNELEGSVIVTATLNYPVPSNDSDGVILDFDRESGTATDTDDYTISDTRITIATGQQEGTATIEVVRDAIEEPHETLTVRASTTEYGGLSDSAALIIEDAHGSIVVGSEGTKARFVPEDNLSRTVKEISGDQTSYYVRLSAIPIADVSVNASVTPSGGAWGGGDKVSVQGHELTFTSTDWDIPQRVAVFGNRDADPDNDVLTITHRATSTDPAYSDSRAFTSVNVTVTDTWHESVRDQPNRRPDVSIPVDDVTLNRIGDTKQISLSGMFSDPDNDQLLITVTSGNHSTATASVAADQSTLTITAKGQGQSPIVIRAADPDGEFVLNRFTVEVVASGIIHESPPDQNNVVLPTTVTLSLDQSSVDESVGTVTITATLDVPAPIGGNIPLDVAAGSTADEHDVTVPSVIFIAGGERSATETITIIDDEVVEEDETVVLSTFVHMGTIILQDKVALTIVDDDRNLPPTVTNAIPDDTIPHERGSQVVGLAGVFGDPDDDSLTIKAVSWNRNIATVSVAADYSALTISAQRGGVTLITVTADDRNGGTTSDTFSVTVKAAPVVASAISDISDLDGGGNTRAVSLNGVFRDADGDALTITVMSSDESKVMATVAADQSSMSFFGVDPGRATITVTARDSDGNQVSDAFKVLVVEPPSGSPTVVSPLPDFSLKGPELRKFDLSTVFHDQDGDDLIFRAVSSNYAVASMWVDGKTLAVGGTGTGTATITVTAEDPDGNQVSDAFEVSVSPAS